MIRKSALVGSLLLLALPAAARPPEELCGTSRLGHLEAAYLHERTQKTAVSGRRLASTEPRGRAEDISGVAVMDGAQGVITAPNRFNLNGLALRFTPEPGGYRLVVFEHGRAEPRAAAGVPLDDLGDDDHRSVPLPFDFPFYGTDHRAAFVHSDGNITFRTPDDGSSARNLGRLVAGPPRLAPVFADLDPSRTPGSVREIGRASWRERV